MTTIVIAVPASTTATKALSGLRTVGFRLSFVDRQGAATEIGPVQRGDRCISFAGVGHLDKSETPRAAGFAVGHKADFFNCAMRLENSAQFAFGCAVGQIAHVKVLHCISSLNRSSKLGGSSADCLPFRI